MSLIRFAFLVVAIPFLASAVHAGTVRLQGGVYQIVCNDGSPGNLGSGYGGFGLPTYGDAVRLGPGACQGHGGFKGVLVINTVETVQLNEATFRVKLEINDGNPSEDGFQTTDSILKAE